MNRETSKKGPQKGTDMSKMGKISLVTREVNSKSDKVDQCSKGGKMTRKQNVGVGNEVREKK